MAERVRVRRLTDEEGRKLQRLVRRGEGKGQTSVVRYRRAKTSRISGFRPPLRRRSRRLGVARAPRWQARRSSRRANVCGQGTSSRRGTCLRWHILPSSGSGPPNATDREEVEVAVPRRRTRPLSTPPDGRIAFAKNTGGNDIWTMNGDGSKQRNLTADNQRTTASPHGRRTAPARAGQVPDGGTWPTPVTELPGPPRSSSTPRPRRRPRSDDPPTMPSDAVRPPTRCPASRHTAG